MSEKRFRKAYCCGDTGVVDKLEDDWFIENINSISDIEKNWDNVIDKLNQVAEENEQLIPFLNIARDYNLTLDQLYGVLEETLEEK